MKYLLYIGRKMLNLFYLFHKCVPVKNRISLISRQSNTPSRDLLMLKRELEKQAEEVEVIISCKMIGKGIKGKIEYLLYMMTKQMHLFATSQVVVLDGYCIAASLLYHKKTLKIVQMWHAMGAMKKFGYATIGEEEGYSEKLALAMRMHRNYDVIFVSSEACKALLAPAYRCTVEQMEVMPLPRVDILCNENKMNEFCQRIYKVYPFLKEKKNILYAPTFRKGVEDEQYIYDLIQSVDFTKYNLIIKLHPLVECKINEKHVLVERHFSSMEMLSVADYVVTDYSAFLFEACIARKPLYRYVPDKERYNISRGFLMDVEKELPGYQARKTEELIGAIETECHDLKEQEIFIKKYVQISEHCTENMAEYILKLRRK